MKAKKWLGQNFLQNRGIALRSTEYANVSKNDTVLEIGPGHGILTAELVKKAKKVIAVEKDFILANEIETNFPKVKVVSGDILKVRLPEFDKIVANIPFNISAPLTFLLLQKDWKCAVLMYQKEFAERFFSKPGEKKYSRLTIAINYYCNVEKMEEVSKFNFKPVPKVDAWIVKLTKKKPTFPTDKHFWEMVNKIFQHKRKITRAALKVSKIKVELPEKLGKKRVNNLELNDLREIYAAVSSL